MRIKQIFLISFTCLMASAVNAQSIERQVMAIAGTSENLGASHISLTVGEAITGTLISEGIDLTQGFQQPGTFSTAIADLEDYPFDVFPNPCVNSIHLKSISLIDYKAIYIIDQTGKLVQKIWKSEIDETVNVHDLPAGKYEMIIASDEILYKAIPILKVN